MKNREDIKDWGKSSINERIAYLIDQFFEGNATKMATAIDVKQSTIRDIVGTRKNSPSFDTMEKIVAYTTLSVSPEWLLLGRGDVHKEDVIISVVI